MARNKKLSYWQKRALEDEKLINDGAKQVEKTIISAYRQAQEYLTQKAKELFKRAQVKTGYEEAELKTLLNETVPVEQLVELQRLAKDISDPNIQASAKKRLDTLAIKHRISRAEDLKAKAHLVTRQIADIQLSESTDYFVDAIHKAYQREQANVSIQKLEAKGVQLEIWNQSDWENAQHEFKQLSTKETRNILESHWHGSNYSKRIWNDTDKLAKRLEELFTVEALAGMSQQEMVRAISKEFNTSIGIAQRLIRTEANYMANQAKLKSWVDNGVEYYRLVVVLDFRTSSICQSKSKENKRYKVSKAVVNGAAGNYPPFHPWCRTIAIADFGKRTAAGMRIANDPISGKTFDLPQRATYEGWINKLRESYSDEEIINHKEKILNRAKDNEQYRHMKTIIPKENWPRNLDSFQEIKYNGSRDWQLTKIDYQRRKRLLNNPNLKLPNAEDATIDNRKFTRYLFDGSNEKGLIKGRLITKKLGYSIENYAEFKREILKRSLQYPVTLKHSDSHGARYEQKMIMYDTQNKPVNVVAGWNVKDGKTHMSTILIKEVK
ncbi:minor capsid protein [Enterococcus sp. MJM12]|uniref:Minor capsid protein n=1 Tax=Candidatus Enterococcus myersii TaxID=2815322 RepID=A0ABS3H3B1_9ENTE|nr:minor capsid protein [Enterococcus sp. MJM12]